jgi:DNA-binding response OmpR family regulator
MAEKFKKILLLEDDDSLGKIISIYLESSGFQLYSASNALMALKVVEELSEKNIELDLLVTDLKNPLREGLELIEILQKRFLSLKYLIISSFISESTENRLQEMGCGNILEKPFSPDILLEKINGII